MEVTVSGLPRQRRLAVQALVERLRGRYSGALTVGQTAVLIVDSAAGQLDWAGPKLATAAAHGIPVVTSDWLEDSALHGFLLSTDGYVLAVGQQGRRSSSGSLTPPAAGSLAGELEQSDPPGLSVQHPPALFDSPEVEKLRGGVQVAPRSPLGGPFVHLDFLSPGAVGSPDASHSPEGMTSLPVAAKAQRPLLAVPANEAHEQLPSPPAAASPAEASSKPCGGLLDGLMPSPLALPGVDDLPLMSPADDDSSASRGEAAEKQLAGLRPGQGDSSGSSVAAAGGASPSPAAALAGKLPPGCEGPAEAAAEAATPSAQGLARRSHGNVPAGAAGPHQTDSDSNGAGSSTLVARFLSRMPNVTLARGSCLPRWLSPDSCSSSDGNGAGSSSDGNGAGSSSVLRARGGRGSAQRRDGSRKGPAGSGSGSSSAGESNSLGRPALRLMRMGGEVEEEGPSSVRSLRRSAEVEPDSCCLPATTRIFLGPLQHHPPAQGTLEGIAEYHSGSESDISRGGANGALPPAVAFHTSAVALPEDGPAMEFGAGDACHGALLLYDIGEGGQREYALALVQTIYRLGDEAWMEHRYLFSREDLLQRPSWAAAARATVHAMRPGELLLSAGSYHSPMHLICGEFRLSFPGHALRAGRPQAQSYGQGQQPQRQRQHLVGCAQAAYTCRKGFDAAAGATVPLRHALEGFNF